MVGIHLLIRCRGVMLFHTLLLRGDMKGESGCMSAFIADVYAAHVENISCKTSPPQCRVQGARYQATSVVQHLNERYTPL